MFRSTKLHKKFLAVLLLAGPATVVRAAVPCAIVGAILLLVLLFLIQRRHRRFKDMLGQSSPSNH